MLLLVFATNSSVAVADAGAAGAIAADAAPAAADLANDVIAPAYAAVAGDAGCC